MDTLVIFFTGLLLFTPDSAARQMHVVGPQVSGGVPAHVIQIGLVRVHDRECDAYERPPGLPAGMPGICYINMNEWSLDLFADAADAQMPLPGGVLNLSQRFARRLDRRKLGNHPSGVRSRVTLGRGMVTDSCALAEWRFGWEEVWLTNVVEWSIPDVRAADLRLTMHRLNHRWWEVLETAEKTLPPLQAYDGRIPLVVRQVPRSPRSNPPRETATHFGEFFRLVNIPRPWVIPERDESNETSVTAECTIGRLTLGPRAIEAIASATTYSCMVASALPGS